MCLVCVIWFCIKRFYFNMVPRGKMKLKNEILLKSHGQT